MSAYHVYAADGYESTHRSLAAAQRAARRGYRRRGVPYQVIQPTHGYTGGGHGVCVYSVGGTVQS